MIAENFLGTSRLIMKGAPLREDGVQEEVVREPKALDEKDAFHHADCAEVPVPTLDRVFLDEAVPSEQLHAVGSDGHALLGAQTPGQRGVAGEVLALLCPAGSAVGE